MSFFDDDQDEQTQLTRPARPRRAASSSHGRSRSSGGATPSPEQIRQRRLFLLGGSAVLIVLLIFIFNACQKSAHRNGVLTYNEQVTQIMRASGNDVSKPLFELLGGGNREGQDATASANRLREIADRNVTAARDLNVPSGMNSAQRNLELTLNLRAGAVERIAGDLSAALGQGRAATDALRKITGQMQALLASDVIFSQRVAPLIREALNDAGLRGTRVASSSFLPSPGWLDLAQAGARINPDAGGPGTEPTGEASPGTHGHGLVAVSINGTALQTGSTPTTNRISVSSRMSLTVKLANQGENNESNVRVTARVTPTRGRAISMSKAVASTTAGTESEVEIPFTRAPARDSTARVLITIAAVPGEKTLDNNTATYSVFFN